MFRRVSPGTDRVVGCERRRREGLYLGSAIAVRLFTEGVGVALVLEAATQLHSVALGGVLLACLMAPSVVAAPVIGAVLDAASSPKRVMLLGGLLMAAGVLVASAAAALPLAVVVVALLAAGCAMPVFVGGLSAFAAEVMPGDVARATSVDALSYNLAGIGGPAIVSGMSLLLGPSTALVALSVVMVGGLLAAAAAPHRAADRLGPPRRPRARHRRRDATRSSPTARWRGWPRAVRS